MKREFPFGNWAWLYPLTYVIHIVEEYLGGFYIWASKNQGIHFTEAEFLFLTALALVLISIATVLITVSRQMDWLLICLSVIILFNVFTHSLDSVATGTYSPGLVTGLLLWLPLGVVTLWKGFPFISNRSRWSGIAVGVFVYLLVYKMPGWVGS